MIIHDQPTNDEIDYALKGGIETLWELFASLEGDREFEELKRKVKNGFKLEFNIEVIVKGYFEEYPDSQNVKIKGYEKTSLYDFWEEIRIREREMKVVLRELFDTGEQEMVEEEDLKHGRTY